jgi:hypothetical protein
VVVRTGLNTTTTRTLTGTANEIAVANGDGVGNHPTIALAATVDLSGKTATAPVKAGTSAATPASCTANKELYIKTDATAGQQLFLCNGAGNGWNLVGDGGGSGAAWRESFRAAICQGSTASTGFSLPVSNAPAPECVTGANSLYGILAFNDATDQSLQGRVVLPSGFSALTLDLKWRAAAASGNVVRRPGMEHGDERHRGRQGDHARMERRHCFQCRRDGLRRG